MGTVRIDAAILRAIVIAVLLAVASTGLAQQRSQAVSVTLIARVEESVSIGALPMSLAPAAGEDTEPNQSALHVLLDWRLLEGRTYRVGYEWEEGEAHSLGAKDPNYFSLRQMEAQAAAFSFLAPRTNHPEVLGVWGDTDRQRSGAASFLLVSPATNRAHGGTMRISVAVF
ncbi:MAG: hypothetical protein LAN62_19050 [Acidobacteriia bacterium]|nr:hypothetical protein [Terriglobia bacterium]